MKYAVEWQSHPRIAGHHSLLSPSTANWIAYDRQKLLRFIDARNAAARGTKLHKLAKDLIDMKIFQPTDGTAFSRYVNDCIRSDMRTEQPLFYSRHCFGHADSILLDFRTLRIWDYKSGIGKPEARQLKIYAALFCLEYGFSPLDLEFDLRIYQDTETGSMSTVETTGSEIRQIMTRIIELNVIIEEEETA